MEEKEEGNDIVIIQCQKVSNKSILLHSLALTFKIIYYRIFAETKEKKLYF